ncbi:MAG: hypothetical protein JO057_25705 [Chloroflexi bacterium]|nr:hypothetical protein [Chloroflexota bacterium]
MSADGRELTLTLRQEVQFHSGRELTTDDVRWTLQRLQTDPVVAATGSFTQIQPLSDVDVIDRYRITLTSAAPWPGVFNLLALMSVLDSEVYRARLPANRRLERDRSHLPTGSRVTTSV